MATKESTADFRLYDSEVCWPDQGREDFAITSDLGEFYVELRDLGGCYGPQIRIYTDGLEAMRGAFDLGLREVLELDYPSREAFAADLREWAESHGVYVAS